MKRIPLVCLLLLCAAQIASAQDWAKATLQKSPRHSEWVTIKHDGRSVETFVVYPESKGKTPVVLIIHDRVLVMRQDPGKPGVKPGKPATTKPATAAVPK